MLRKVLWRFLFIYLILFPFGQFIKLPLNFIPGEVNVYLTDLLVGMIGVAGVIWGTNKATPLDKPFLLFVTTALFSLMVASPALTPMQLAISSLYLLRLLFYGLFFSTIYNLIKSPKEKKLVLSSLVVVGATIAAFGLIQYLFLPDLRALLFFGWDEHVNRVVGTFLDPNFTAMILVLTMVLFLERDRLGGLRNLGMLGVTFAVLLLTYSRSGYLAFVAAAGALAYLQKSGKIFIVSLAALLLGVYLLPKETSEGTKLERVTSINLRLENFKEGLALFKSNPVFGVGFNALRYVREPLVEKYGPSHSASGIDNSFLFVLTTTGLVGLLAFVNLTAKIIKESIGGKVSKVIIPSLAALFVSSLFVNSLFYPWVLGWLALLLAAFLRTSKH